MKFKPKYKWTIRDIHLGKLNLIREYQGNMLRDLLKSSREYAFFIKEQWSDEDLSAITNNDTETPIISVRALNGNSGTTIPEDIN